MNKWKFCKSPFKGFPGGASSKEPTCQCRKCKRWVFDPLVGKIPWRRAQQPTPVFLPGEFHGQRSLMGYSPSSHRESDMTEWLTHTHTQTHTLPSILISNKENHFSYLWLISIHIIDLFFQLCPGIIYQLFPSHYESFISQSLFSVSIDMHSTLFHYLNFFSIFSHHIFLLLTVKVILHLSLFFILLPSPFTAFTGACGATSVSQPPALLQLGVQLN